MTVDHLLSQLDGVRRSGRGWIARCPAHDDHAPSLSIHEGEHGALLKCWAGCTVDEIVSAMGLRLVDLFYDSDLSPEERRWMPRRPRTPRFDWRDYAEGLHSEADGLWLRGVQVLEHARDRETTQWSDDDLDQAMDTVACAQTDLARSDCFFRIAMNARGCGLKEEHERAS